MSRVVEQLIPDLWKTVGDDPVARLARASLADRAVSERRAAIDELWNPEVDRRLWEFANANRVAPIVGHALDDALGERCPTDWVEAHDEVRRRLMRWLDEMEAIAVDLHERGVRLVALKNAGIARGIYPCSGCCPMGDLDVLVERRRFREAHEAVLRHGFELACRSPHEPDSYDDGEAAGSTEYRKRLDDGTMLWFELHWRPVAGRWIRADQEPDGAELVARSIEVQGSRVRILSAQDNLLQVALHTAKHSYVRAPGVRLHTDVDRIVARQAIDWRRFVERVQSIEARTAVFYSLAIPRMLLDTPVPWSVLEALAPAAWRRRLITGQLQSAGLFDPDARKFSNPAYMLFNALLYDDLGGLWRAVVPEADWMRQRYDIAHDAVLPAYHLRRWADLLWRRSL